VILRLPVAIALVIALSAALAGCVPSARQQGPGTIDCGPVPSGACNEQADLLASTAGGSVRSITLTCRVAACTRAGGAGTAAITLADGRSLTRTWSYVGDPSPLPVPVCIGIAPDLCREQVDSVIDNVSPSHHLVSVTVTCQGTCTSGHGEVDIVFQSADGTTDRIGSGWSSTP
jgi:hypothetical protein